MDGLSTAANIIAVLDAAAKTADGLKRILDLRHAPQEVLQYMNEISDFRALAVMAQEVLGMLDGSENIGPSNVFNARLEGIVERALTKILDLNDIIHNRIIISASANSATQSVKISRIEWLKRSRKLSLSSNQQRLSSAANSV